ncbi:MAG TPA: hypothetical protein VD767_11835 [Thermomicrobiales bacterium]|nr:hypothetical protein [Thermomicrobiales bacterium]
MNPQMQLPSPPVNLIRLPHPIDVTDLPYLVMVMVVPCGDGAIPPGEGSLNVEDLDEEPTWEDAECL